MNSSMRYLHKKEEFIFCKITLDKKQNPDYTINRELSDL